MIIIIKSLALIRAVSVSGLISYVAPRGGGTTDYAVEIYYEAIKKAHTPHTLQKEHTWI